MNILRTTLILRLTRETIEDLEEQLLDLKSKIIKELEYSDMPCGSGGKKTSYQEKLLEKRETIIGKINEYRKNHRQIIFANKIKCQGLKSKAQ